MPLTVEQLVELERQFPTISTETPGIVETPMHANEASSDPEYPDIDFLPMYISTKQRCISKSDRESVLAVIG